MTIIGMDLSSKKVAAVSSEPRAVLSKIVSRSKSASYEPANCKRAKDAVRRWLDGIDHNGELVAFIEEPLVGFKSKNVRSTIVQSHIHGVMHAELTEFGYAVIPVTVNEWKRDICGDGSADKDAVAASVAKALPKLYRSWPEDQDVLDAAGVLLYGQRQLGAVV